MTRAVHARPNWPLLAVFWLAGCLGALEDSPRGPNKGQAAAPSEGEQTDSAQDPETGRVTPNNPEFVPIAPLVRRLTHDQYLFTLKDILGVTLSDEDAALLPADRPLEGFVNTASGQGTVPDHVLSYNVLAERALASPAADAFLAQHTGCKQTSLACGAAFIASAGTVLFRRPLDARERGVYEKLFFDLTAEGAELEEAVRGVTQALLQAPQFLYLVEEERDDDFDGLRAVRGYEMASRLSYYLWQSAPDAPLLKAAANGSLDDAEGVSRELVRMLKDARARRSSARFILDWARLESLPDDDGLRGELTETAIAFYQDYLWDKRGVMGDIFTAKRAFLTPSLAEGYGVASLGEGILAYDLTDVPGRVGLLAQPGIVAGMTNADGGEIVARGLFQMEQLFCGEAPNPPASLQDQIDGFVDTLPKGASQRAIAEARLERPECAACHAGFDPVGYALEHFDARGRYREKDALGNTLSDEGWIPAQLSGEEELPFADFESFAQAIAKSEKVQHCLTERNVQYALGHRLERAHTAAILEVGKVAQGRSYEELVQAIVRHDLFRTLSIE